jgi:hypothetical protein
VAGDCVLCVVKCKQIVQGDQKLSVHVIITVQKEAKIF